MPRTWCRSLRAPDGLARCHRGRPGMARGGHPPAVPRPARPSREPADNRDGRTTRGAWGRSGPGGPDDASRRGAPGAFSRGRPALPGGADLVHPPRCLRLPLRRGSRPRWAQPGGVPATGRRARRSVGTGLSEAEFAGSWSENTTPAGLAERFIAVCEGGDVNGLIGMLDPEVASFPVVIGLPPMPAVRGAEAVAARVMHRFGPLAGVSMQPFDVEGRAAMVVGRGDEVVAVVRLDDRDGRIIHVHTVARPSLAR